MRDRILALLTIVGGLPEQKVGECRISTILGLIIEIEACGAAVAIFRLLHPHCGKPGADGVVPMLDGKIVVDVFVDVSLKIGCASVAQTSKSSDANIWCTSVWILVNRIVGELRVKGGRVCNATEVRIDCAPRIHEFNLVHYFW